MLPTDTEGRELPPNDRLSEEVHVDEKLQEGLDLARSIHADQRPRPDGPYIDHVLRVAYRVQHEFGINEIDIIIAAALHDSLEDQSEKLALLNMSEQDQDVLLRAIEYLRQRFGDRVARIVQAVTNPPMSSELGVEERNRIYAQHVEEAIRDPDVLYVKLADFMDNGLNLIDIADPKRKVKLARKYLPLYGLFINRIQDVDIHLPDGKKEEVLDQLRKAEELAHKLASS